MFNWIASLFCQLSARRKLVTLFSAKMSQLGYVVFTSLNNQHDYAEINSSTWKFLVTDVKNKQEYLKPATNQRSDWNYQNSVRVNNISDKLPMTRYLIDFNSILIISTGISDSFIHTFHTRYFFNLTKLLSPRNIIYFIWLSRHWTSDKFLWFVQISFGLSNQTSFPMREICTTTQSW